MDITQAPRTVNPPLISGETEASDDKATATLSSDFETFLRMLTVQMQNQDPLNPIDSTDYAVQLATFSSVEQQVLTNDLLASLAGNMAGDGLSALGQWVGMEVRGAPSANFEGQSVDIAAPVITDADRRLLVVADEFGRDVARFDVDLTEVDQTWNGTLINGSQANPGQYSFRVEGYKEGALIDTQPATSYARVTEARLDGTSTVLVLDSGETMNSSDVTALREPRDPTVP